MTKQWDVAVAGEIFADHIFAGFEKWPQPGEELFTDSYAREVGGGAAITACALARLGRSAAVFGVIGKEDGWIQHRFADFGVASDGLRSTEGGTAVTVSISTREDRSFFTWPGANKDLREYLRSPQTKVLLERARHVHFAMTLSRPLALELLPPLRSAGCTISIDPGHHPEWLRNRDNWQTCSECDFFLPNELEGRIMTGEQSAEKMLAVLTGSGIRGSVIKLGRAGAAMMTDGLVCHASAPAVEAVDTTGAGDAFDAGFIDAFLDGAAPSEMIRRACICGSLSTRRTGALAALPGREELNRFHE
ncbi:carbohydrate kinase family protein [Paracidobacterium acidisoli]|uniref:Carbohydrate kinase family protein n=1 Tax=Paracidobacterium acidisoli TaxID=2303751 RepID=A0A372ISR5_9BACT|nr:carbohydrate kinase family protein [Paracidobacterium acidisoli]MBT9330594.1 carbohydrate kinase family protein [Paracidobacterium acidisoli]